MKKSSLLLFAPFVLFLIICEFSVILQGKSICGPLFPRVLGGSTGSTAFHSMDFYEGLTVVGGNTRDSALTGEIQTTNISGLLLSYVYDSISPQWVRIVKSVRSIWGVAINP
jgi:hypothetical protein